MYLEVRIKENITSDFDLLLLAYFYNDQELDAIDILISTCKIIMMFSTSLYRFTHNHDCIIQTSNARDKYNNELLS